MTLTIKPAQRIENLDTYFFAQVAEKLKHKQVINLGAGSPDLPPPPSVITALTQSAQQPSSHGYPPFHGLAELRQSFALWMKQRFSVILDADTEVLPLLGSKEGIVHLSLALLNPRDKVLVPNPGYIPFTAGAKLAQAKVLVFDLREENGFLPDFEQITKLASQKPKLMWLNFPNNPTGATASLSLFKKIIAFGKHHNILICHDNPYSEIGFDGYLAPSILQVDGAKEVAVEFHSFSKTFNMAGWRVGMIVGNSQVISALLKLKTNIDSGTFIPIQQAATSALKVKRGWIIKRNRLLQTRRDLLLNILRHAGFKPLTPKAGLYIWAKLPQGEVDDINFCLKLLDQTKVFITPGSIFGSNGQSWIRVSLCQPTKTIKELGKRLKQI